VVGEEVPGVGDRQRERRIVDRVQPRERAVGAVGHDGVPVAAEADEAVRELDHALSRDLDGPEARRVDGDGGHGGGGLLEGGGTDLGSLSAYLRKSISDVCTMLAPARRADW